MATEGAPLKTDTEFDHTDPAFARNPDERFKVLREQCPIVHSPKFGGFWLFTRYDDIQNATRDPQTFSSAAGITLPPIGAGLPLPPLEVDPPEHSAYRKLLQQEFSRGRMRQLEGSIRKLTNELIDSFIGRGSADLMREIAEPLPAMVIAELMGFPRSDSKQFHEYLSVMIEASVAGDEEAGGKVAVAFLGHIGQALADRRVNPRDDLLTRVALADIDGETISEEAALGTAWTIIVAGFETTVGGIGSLLMHMGSDPELKRRLLADESLIPRAVEETVRVEAPIQGMRRTLTRDVRIRDAKLSTGDLVWLSYSSANKDEEKFADPGTFDLDRNPNRHFGFGDGIHRCVGAPLAQLEMRVAAEEVLRRMPGLRVDDPDAIGFFSAQSRKPRTLPCSW
jgi:cytochrome P450